MKNIIILTFAFLAVTMVRSLDKGHGTSGYEYGSRTLGAPAPRGLFDKVIDKTVIDEVVGKLNEIATNVKEINKKIKN